MPKKSNDKEEDIARKEIIRQSISEEMKDSYLDYAMSVITARALPDVRDGLKPVHRRILYAMNGMGLSAGAKFRKSAAVVGEVLGKYHPHGDTSVYDALVKLAQPFSSRYPLVLGQGNFGCFTKDTKIELTDGRKADFATLIAEQKKGNRHFTYTVNKLGRIAIAEIRHPRLTRRNAELVRVTLDNGEEVRCTPDHRFMLRGASYKEAQYLAPSESLMPLYQRLSEKTDRINREGYTLIHQPKTGEWTPAHHLADNYNLTYGVYRKNAGRVRHHCDFNKTNNNPTNIIRMQWGEHWRIHHTHAALNHKNASYRRKIADGRRVFWSQPENREAYAKRISKRNKKNWQNPEYREKMRAFLSEVNKRYNAEHPERRQEFSARATKTFKRLWETPEYRAFYHERIVASNKRRTTRACLKTSPCLRRPIFCSQPNGSSSMYLDTFRTPPRLLATKIERLGSGTTGFQTRSNLTGKYKFLSVCRHVLEKRLSLNAEKYEYAREKIYPYGSATKWETGLKKYFQNDVARVYQEVKHNHRVVSVERLTEREDVYDLTIDGTHNFALASGVFVHNSVDGDSSAAMRYTEAKMSRIAAEVLRDLEKETVNWRPNYDGTHKEPAVLPAAVPNVLLNGALGIAVGMATNIPPHNLRELIDAAIRLIDNPKASADDLLEYVKGPDFPTGGIAFNAKDIAHAYASGRGGVVVRGEAEITETKSGAFQIVASSLPYRVNKADFVARIAELVRDKKLDGVKALRDESARGDTRVVVDLKQGGQPQTVLNYLYKHTDLETTFHYNMLALVDGVPQTLSLKTILEEFIKHRETVVRRRTEFDLKKAEERAHILEGLNRALDNIDKVIKTIKASRDAVSAHKELKSKFRFTDVQATAILEMRLQKLAGLERKAVLDELKEKQKLIKDLKALLASREKMFGVIKDELREVGGKHGDERRTKIVKSGVKTLAAEDLVAEEESVLVLTRGGYLKRTNPNEYRRQKRGGVGVMDLSTKEEDFISVFLTASTHDNILFFTNTGKAYQTKMYEIPEGRRATKGKSIMNFLPLAQGEFVTSVLAVPKEARTREKTSLVMVTEGGTIKKVAARSFFDVRRNGIIAVKLKNSDTLFSSFFVDADDDIILVTAKGQSIRFKASNVREMGRAASGVRAVRLAKGDKVIGADEVKKPSASQELLVMSAKGYGKRTPLEEYRVQTRGGSGIKTAKLTSKTGALIGAKVVTEEYGEIVSVSKHGTVIRVALEEIPKLGRSTQGVRVMKLRAGDEVATFITL